MDVEDQLDIFLRWLETRMSGRYCTPGLKTCPACRAGMLRAAILEDLVEQHRCPKCRYEIHVVHRPARHHDGDLDGRPAGRPGTLTTSSAELGAQTRTGDGAELQDPCRPPVTPTTGGSP